MNNYKSSPFIKDFLIPVFLLIITSNSIAQSYNYVTEFGSSGTGNGQFDRPCGMAFDASDNLYVVDSYNSRIQKFNSSNIFIKEWGSNGNGDGQFSVLRDVAVDPSGNIFVVDANRIQKFDSDGNFISKWGSYGSGDGQFWGAAGLDIDDLGNVFVADRINHRIQKFDNNGVFITAFGKPQLSYPSDVVVNSSGEVFVSGTNAIYKFSNVYAYEFKQVCFFSINIIALDASGNVYVADSQYSPIWKFTFGLTSSSKKFYGSFGDHPGELNYPYGLAFNSAGDMFISDYTDNNIVQYSSALPSEMSLKFNNTIVPNGGSIDFGTISLTSDSTITITVENTVANTYLYLYCNPKIEIAGTNSSDFSVDVTSTNGAIVGNSSTTFNVTFTPGQTGARSGRINVLSSGNVNSYYRINFTGSGDVASTINPSFEESVSVYPNPSTNGRLTIQSPYPIQAIVLTDMNGREEIYSDVSEISTSLKGIIDVKIISQYNIAHRKILFR